MTDYTRYEPAPYDDGRAALWCTDCAPAFGRHARLVWVYPHTQVTALSLANLIAVADEHEREQHPAPVVTHTYAVDVFELNGNHWFGADGWTWCKVIDGEPHDYAAELPHCDDEQDAREKAAVWLASVTAGGAA